MNGTQDMIKNYTKWLFENFKYKEVDGAIEVETPYVNHLDDFIRIYIQKIGHDEYLLSDDGQTVNELEMMNINLNTKTREKIVKDMNVQFNTELKDDDLFKTTNFKNFPQNKHDFIQAILRFYDLTYTTRDKVQSLFYEEVKSFLFENEIYGSSIDLAGATGIKHHIDYLIAPTKNTPETLINFVNHPDYNSITNDVYTYNDVKSERIHPRNLPLSYKIIVNDIDHKVPDKVTNVAQHEGIEVLYWSDKPHIIDALKQPA